MAELHKGRKPLLEATLKIESSGDGEYQIDFEAPGVSATTNTCFPLAGRDADLLEIALKDIPFAGTPFQRTPPGTPVMEKFGCLFYETIFRNGVRKAFKQCLKKAVQEQKQLRLRLIILAPEFAALPLEYFFDPEQQEYLCLHPNISLVRTPTQVNPYQPFKVNPPLNILVMISASQDQEPLDALSEEAVIIKALATLQAKGLVAVTWVHSWDALQREIESEKTWHVLHLIGHGAFDPRTQECQIAVVDRHGKTHKISARQLAGLLKIQQSFRLAFLNICEGAKTEARNLFSSAGALLALQGIQAVVALQASISDKVAIKLTEVFYSKLAEGLPVDDALTSARRAIMLDVNRPHTLEWGTAVLFLSSADALLFEVVEEQPSLPESTKSAQEMSLLEELAQCEAILAEHTHLATQLRRPRLLIELSRYQEALIAIDHLIDELIKNVSPAVKQTLYQLKGDAHKGLGDMSAANAAYERAATYKSNRLN